MQLLRQYRKTDKTAEVCYYIETSAPLTPGEHAILKEILSETFEPHLTGEKSFLKSESGIISEIGPRLNFSTSHSTNAVSICHSCGLNKITRLEVSRRNLLPTGSNSQLFIEKNCDRMTETFYKNPLATFETGIKPKPVQEIPIMTKGKQAIRDFGKKFGLPLDEQDVDFLYEYFMKTEKRNPTDVELIQIGNMNSDHSRHLFFKGKIIIDGVAMPHTLFDLFKSTLEANPSNSLVAYSDNSSVIRGYNIWTIVPVNPGQPSGYQKGNFTYHILFTAETHNFPTGVAPIPGAETGTGGRIRDVIATGRGAMMVAATVGFCVGALHLKGYHIPGEPTLEEAAAWGHPSNLATPLEVLLKEKHGGFDYGNKIGEPVILGICRSFDMRLPNNERRAWLKPIMFTGGVGHIREEHLYKEEPQVGWKIVKLGGPAYRIGFGGGAASSMIQGENEEHLDTDAVQRGDPEMENKGNRVALACVEKGINNPIKVFHDQGAGGLSNDLTELIEKIGGRIYIRRVKLGDDTLSVAEIWVSEFQECYGLLVPDDRINELLAICIREKCPCEVVGEVTGDHRIVVYDEQDRSTPVDFHLPTILGKVPQKEYRDQRQPKILKPLELPTNLTIEKAAEIVFQQLAVGSSAWAVRGVDQSVSGFIARSQNCGPAQIPVSDVGVVALSHFCKQGAAIAMGEQPIKMLVDVPAGIRMAVAEMLTNMASALITKIEDIKVSVNWMWAAKMLGEPTNLYDASEAMAKIMIELGIAEDGGKDSSSMAAKILAEIIKTPGQSIMSGYVTMDDITKVVTPDIKYPGKSALIHLDIGNGKRRLGGSALAQACKQIGNESPDIDSTELLKNSILAVQELIRLGLIHAYHDISDGGIFTTLVEMAMAAKCGLNINIRDNKDPIAELFAEEAGMVIEVSIDKINTINEILSKFNCVSRQIGITSNVRVIQIEQDGRFIFKQDTKTLRKIWEMTSDRLEVEQIGEELALVQTESYEQEHSGFKFSFDPIPTSDSILEIPENLRPKVAILREEGSNGDREMRAAFWLAGFTPYDINMQDLLNGKITLDDSHGIVFVGGFSYADVLDAGKGWAMTILHNPKLKKMFDQFFEREDTFSLGICNGFQVMTLLGLLPWRDIPMVKQPRLIKNKSDRFEHRFTTVKIQPSPAIMLADMEGSILGVPIAHGEGKLFCPDPKMMDEIIARQLVPMSFIDQKGIPTERYPINPNGSPHGITGLCSPDGRHLGLMPHPERVFQKWQWAYMPEDLKSSLEASPWLKMFQNAYDWVLKTQ